jgi:hypothetical protein
MLVDVDQRCDSPAQAPTEPRNRSRSTITRSISPTATTLSELPSAHTVKVNRRPRVAADGSANTSTVSPGPTARKCSIRTAAPTVVCPLSMNSAADGRAAAALLSAHG